MYKYQEHNLSSNSHQNINILFRIIKEKLQFNKHPKIKPQFNPQRIPTHVLTNPQLWITHPLSLSELTCLPTVIAASLAVPWDSSSYSSDCSDRILMRILKLAKYRLKAQVEKDEGPEAETLSKLLIVAEDLYQICSIFTNNFYLL